MRELLHEGNVRRIIVKDADGNRVLEIPVNVGIVAVLVTPAVAAVGALRARAEHWQIEVERTSGRV